MRRSNEKLWFVKTALFTTIITLISWSTAHWYRLQVEKILKEWSNAIKSKANNEGPEIKDIICRYNEEK